MWPSWTGGRADVRTRGREHQRVVRVSNPASGPAGLGLGGVATAVHWPHLSAGHRERTGLSSRRRIGPQSMGSRIDTPTVDFASPTFLPAVFTPTHPHSQRSDTSRSHFDSFAHRITHTTPSLRLTAWLENTAGLYVSPSRHLRLAQFVCPSHSNPPNRAIASHVARSASSVS